MGIKFKMRSLCSLTAACVLVGTLAAAVPVRADDEIPYGAKLEYERRHAYQEYIIEHANDEKEVTQENAKSKGFEHVLNITLDIGDTYSVVGTNCHYGSSNSNVASVDSNGTITAHNDGNCTVITYLPDGSHYCIAYVNVRRANKNDNNNNNNNNNVVYYPVYNPYYNPYYNPVYTPVYTAPAPTGNTWLAIATNMVVAAPQKGTVNLSAASPLYFDANFANVLKLRPDVTVNVTFGYAGHFFLLTIPRGYNLTSKLNAAGAVDFVTLSNVIDGKIRCKLLY